MGAVEELKSVPRAVFDGRTARGPEWLAERRRAAMATFDAHGFPTRRWEAWKHIDLTPVLRSDFHPPQTAGAVDDGLAGRVDQLLPRSDGPRLVFIDGYLDASRSDYAELPAGLSVQPLSQALADDVAWLQQHLAAHADPANSPFIALNTALMDEGVAIHVARGAMIEAPLLIVCYTSAACAGHAVYPRVIVHGEEASHLRVVEYHSGDPEAAYLSCPVTELVADAGAQVDLTRISEEGDAGCQLGAVSGTAARDARVGAHSFVWGGDKVRVDIEATVQGDNGEGDLTGVHLSDGQRFVDHHTWVHHDAEHTRSRQVFKGVLDGRSESVFDGLIKVHPGAQKTDAEQENRNLLLSPRAFAHSNPRLEIFADDVRCTHGSTVGELDEQALFYMRARGIDPLVAKSLLTYAFVAEVLETVRCSQAADYERALLRRFLPGGEQLEGFEA
ncbi:Fe-S cluster assembly protein SufD [Halorhodospira halophila]|uniref:Iron-regulated ABC transporter permease protein SufD n=1 Tax=Halorhodospira halophila (strain DSM 244 / SL1) TaxID=349124 RepID=A1WUG1_HALHL|nr:Fe-S cluster assembly protein SufD [Halorhodospira halophila]ABM61323.1 Iron-regulated ABC transporter permease protein SufD [Halorhodospira halophila SL1]